MGQSPPGSTVFNRINESDCERGLPFIQGTAEFGRLSPTPNKCCIRPLKTAQPGDCLISVRAPVGDTNLADQTVAIGRGLAAVRFNRADPNFGWYSLNHAKPMLNRVAQGSTFEAIGGIELQTLPVALPTMEEQRAIAGVLDAVDKAIERGCEECEALRSAMNSISDALLTGRIRTHPQREKSHETAAKR